MKKITCVLLIMVFTVIVLIYAQDKKDTESGELEKRAKQFIEYLVKEDFTEIEKMYYDKMKTALPEEKLMPIWRDLISKIGPFEECITIQTQKYMQQDLIVAACKFQKANFDIKVFFNSSQQVAGLFFAPNTTLSVYNVPEYANPEKFYEKEVTVGTQEWPLSGTLTIPEGEGVFPAIVLVHGTGAHDRDETIGSNKPFRDLAYGLASRGIAVLRYEKRSKQYPGKFSLRRNTLTFKEITIDDALAAVSLLRSREKIDAEKVFVLGHSLGGTLIPRIGEQEDGDIAGFIVMAGSARPLEDVYLEQMNYMFALDGTVSPEEKTQLEKIKEQAAMVKNPALSLETPASQLPLTIPPSFWIDLRGYSPPETAKQLKQPMLILQGERDYQVTVEDFTIWKHTLASKENITFRSYPNLNHIFVKGSGKSTPGEYQQPGNVDKAVIDDIAAWLAKQ